MSTSGPTATKEWFFHLFNPQTPLKQGKKNWAYLEHFSRQILSLILSKLSPKYILKPLILLFSQQSRGSFLALFFSSLVLGPWIWGFKGVYVAF